MQGYEKMRFSTNTLLYLGSIQDRAIVTIEWEHLTLPRLSNGTIFNDVE